MHQLRCGAAVTTIMAYAAISGNHYRRQVQLFTITSINWEL